MNSAKRALHSVFCYLHINSVILRCNYYFLADRERHHRKNMPEIRTEDYRNIRRNLAPDDLPYYCFIQLAAFIKPPEYDSFDRFRTGNLQQVQRTQIAADDLALTCARLQDTVFPGGF